MPKHTGTIPLETDRLILRQFQKTDTEDMYKNRGTDPDVYRFWQWTPHKCIVEAKELHYYEIASRFRSLNKKKLYKGGTNAT